MNALGQQGVAGNVAESTHGLTGVVRRLVNAVTPAPAPRKTRITVFRQLGGIGDWLMITPVFRGLKEKYEPLGGCHITVATSWAYMAGALPDLALHNPHIDLVIRLELDEFCPPFTKQNRWDYRNVPNEPFPLCTQDTDMCIDLNVICSVVETNTMPHVIEHRTDIWCRHAAGGLNPSSKKPVLVLTPEEMEEGARWANENIGEGIRVGIVLQANDPWRDWPHTREFVNMIQREGYLPVTIDASRRLDTSGWPRAVPAINGMRIRKVASIVRQLDVLVTPDTGVLHVAGAVGTPILGLFGSTTGGVRMREYAGHYTDGRKFAECAPCWYLKPCLEDKDLRKRVICMSRITPTLVLHELEAMLERFGRGRPNPIS